MKLSAVPQWQAGLPCPDPRMMKNRANGGKSRIPIKNATPTRATY